MIGSDRQLMLYHAVPTARNSIFPEKGISVLQPSRNPDLGVTSWIRLIVAEFRVSFVIRFDLENQRMLNSGKLKAESIRRYRLIMNVTVFSSEYFYTNTPTLFIGKYTVKILRIYECIFNDYR